MGVKGGNYERQFAKQLSEWWTAEEKDPKDGIFWRTSNSGGRATVRGRVGKETKDQHGDITAIDPIGSPLLRFTCIECKRGYAGFSINDLIDKPEKAKESKYAEWIDKAKSCRRLSKSLFWMLVVRRDRRLPIVLIPQDMKDELLHFGSLLIRSHPHIEIQVTIKDKIEYIYCTTLDEFFRRVDRSTILRVVNNRE